MSKVQADFNQAVQQALIIDPHTPLLGNVNALALFTADEIRSDLQAQLTNRVRWTESIQEMTRHGVTHYIEIGSGNVLSGLIKRIDEAAFCLPFGSPSDFAQM
jgi:[acyl-carrier-protein] S-malonyltransferase